MTEHTLFDFFFFKEVFLHMILTYNTWQDLIEVVTP